jgi:hypothetical protein
VAQEPFLEIRVDTDAFHFIQELFRLSEAFRERSPLRIDWVWVQVKGVRFPYYQYEGDEPDIAELTSNDLEALTLPSESTWTLYFNTYQHESRWKELFEVELRRIGGGHPLLVRFQLCSDPLDSLLADLLSRCGSYWDAQIVSLPRQRDRWDRFFHQVDVRQDPWLSALEHRYYGTAYESIAPSVSRTKREQPPGTLTDEKSREQSSKYAQAVGKVTSDGASDLATAEAAGPTLSVVGVAQEAAAPSVSAETVAPAETAAHTRAAPESPPAEATPTERSRAKRIYGPTEEKIGKMRELLAEKRDGRHRGRPWSWAYNECGIDLKTAQKHLAAEREEWDEINARQLGRGAPGKKPKQPGNKRKE